MIGSGSLPVLARPNLGEIWHHGAVAENRVADIILNAAFLSWISSPPHLKVSIWLGVGGHRCRDRKVLLKELSSCRFSHENSLIYTRKRVFTVAAVTVYFYTVNRLSVSLKAYFKCLICLCWYCKYSKLVWLIQFEKKQPKPTSKAVFFFTF